MYRGVTDARCGTAQAAMGPFYCPNDQKVYLDTSFFNEIESRFRGCSGNSCRFAQAYVIAHEVGHHVQNQLGVLPRAETRSSSAGNRAAANHIQVQVELQADCFAGVWAKRENDLLTGARQTVLHRSRRRRGRVAHGVRDRRRYVAATGAGPGGARQLYPRHVRAAPALVQQRLQVGRGRKLQYLRLDAALGLA